MAKIKSIQKIKNLYNNTRTSVKKRQKYVYDIEIADNHNYLANDILVSNSSATTYQDLNKKSFQDIYYRYGLTGTFFRDDGTDMNMHGVLSNALFSMDTKTAIKNGYLVPPNITIYEIPIKYADPNIKYRQAYEKGIIENIQRNQLVIDKALEYEDKYTLILVKEIVHGEELQKNIPNSVFLTGQNSGAKNAKLIKQFEKKEFSTIIATTVVGEGTDIPCIDVIINAQGMKAEGFLLQRIGRGMRLAENKNELIVIDFYDKDSKYLQKHSDRRVETYSTNLTNDIKIAKI